MSTNWNFLSRAKNISARAIFFIENFIVIVLWTPRSLWLHSIYTKCAYNKNAIKTKNQKKNLLVSPHLIWNKMVLRVPSGHWKSLDILAVVLWEMSSFFCSNGCLCKVRKSYTTAATLEPLIHISQYFVA